MMYAAKNIAGAAYIKWFGQVFEAFRFHIKILQRRELSMRTDENMTPKVLSVFTTYIWL